jgi:hypothetical protein
LLSWCHGTLNCCLWVRQAAFFLVSLFTHDAKTERYMHRFHWCHFLRVDAFGQELHGCLYRSKCVLLKLHGRQWSLVFCVSIASCVYIMDIFLYTMDEWITIFSKVKSWKESINLKSLIELTLSYKLKNTSSRI